MRSITNLGENLVSNENSQTGLKQDEKKYRERERERERAYLAQESQPYLFRGPKRYM